MSRGDADPSGASSFTPSTLEARDTSAVKKTTKKLSSASSPPAPYMLLVVMESVHLVCALPLCILLLLLQLPPPAGAQVPSCLEVRTVFQSLHPGSKWVPEAPVSGQCPPPVFVHQVSAGSSRFQHRSTSGPPLCPQSLSDETSSSMLMRSKPACPEVRCSLSLMFMIELINPTSQTPDVLVDTVCPLTCHQLIEAL